MEEERLQFKDVVRTLILALLVTLVVNNFIGLASIVGHSMAPTLDNGARHIVSKVAYVRESPRHNDIIVFYPSALSSDTFVKRIVAVPGDRIEIRDNKVFLNEEELSEPYIFGTMNTAPVAAIDLLPGEYFVLGDNRNNSSDSRDFGPIRKEQIIGKLLRK